MVLRRLAVSLATLLTSTALSISPAWADDKAQTFTGRVSDAMCGAHHMMEGGAEDCTRACVKKGSKYALVVGEKVYTLDTSDKATLDKLDQLANKNAKVTGTASGDTIAVKSAVAGK
ncbi:MAG: hypothetical protein DMG89_16615 [Acidobacteria bacterium]|nr:MAG: hypothetical protein DMG89_16615 [Acidobacteriota bacterium]